jgi:hypothetical protein
MQIKFVLCPHQAGFCPHFFFTDYDNKVKALDFGAVRILDVIDLRLSIFIFIAF